MRASPAASRKRRPDASIGYLLARRPVFFPSVLSEPPVYALTRMHNCSIPLNDRSVYAPNRNTTAKLKTGFEAIATFCFIDFNQIS